VDIPIPEVALVLVTGANGGQRRRDWRTTSSELGQMTEEISLNPRRTKRERRGNGRIPKVGLRMGSIWNGGQTTGSKPGSGSGMDMGGRWQRRGKLVKALEWQWQR